MSTEAEEQGGPKLVAIVDNGGTPVDEDDLMIEDALRSMGLEVVRGKIDPCKTCGYFECVCHIVANHEERCRYRVAATCAIPISCACGYDVCAKCDPCTCGTTVVKP